MKRLLSSNVGVPYTSLNTLRSLPFEDSLLTIPWGAGPLGHHHDIGCPMLRDFRSMDTTADGSGCDLRGGQIPKPLAAMERWYSITLNPA